MGLININDFLPESFRPDDSAPIKAWGLPPRTAVTRSGFVNGEDLCFEGETRVQVRLCQREWRYQRYGEAREQIAKRWRLELSVGAKKRNTLKPGHDIVIAQKPYGNQWLQFVKLKKYSKKEQPVPKLPADVPKDADPVEWLESHLEFDPWEQGKRYVAGISFPNGFWNPDFRNTSGDFVFGCCPDKETAIKALLRSRPIKALLEMTRKNRIIFSHEGKNTRLFPEVIEEAEFLMAIAIQQALAGPDSVRNWKGKPVSDYVSEIYRSHLNNLNRIWDRRRRIERPDQGDFIARAQDRGTEALDRAPFPEGLN